MGLVGREKQLAELREHLARALQGERQAILVTGEPGIGKTALVEAFLAESAATISDSNVSATSPVVGRGQCVERFGAAEAYRPVLEICTQLASSSSARYFRDALEQHAPTWLAQVPGCLDEQQRADLLPRTRGATPDRVVRELCLLLETVSAAAPLILVFEDLHWSDFSSLDALSALGARRQPARILIIGTYRPAEATVPGNPLRGALRELRTRGRAVEQVLPLLDEDAVGAYLIEHLPSELQPRQLAHGVHQRTEGNPLFMVTVTEQLRRRAVTAATPESDVPADLRNMIQRQLERLEPTQQHVLQAASVIGIEFSAAAVAAALANDEAVVAEWCLALAHQRQFIQSRRTERWPDDTLTTYYAFTHGLYRELLHQQLPEARRREFHLAIGHRLETAFGRETGDLAAVLAVHFEQGGDLDRAADHLARAGENAARRFACREAIDQYRQAIALLHRLPDTPQQWGRELPIQIALGQALTAVEGNAAPAVGDAYRQARELCRRLDDPIPALFASLAGLFLFHLARADIPTAREVAEQLMRIAEQTQDPYLLLNGHTVMLVARFYGGDIAEAHAHVEQLLTQYDRVDYLRFASDVGYDARAIARAISVCILHAMGFPEQAQRRALEAVATARESGHPLSLAQTYIYTMRFFLWCRDVEGARAEADALAALCEEQGFSLLLTGGTFVQGWVLVQQDRAAEGLRRMQHSFDAAIALHSEIGLVDYSVWLAEAYGRAGFAPTGLTLIADAGTRMERGGERLVEPEVYRVNGELLLASGGGPAPAVEAEAERCFHAALASAQRRRMKTWELRAAMSLARLWNRRGRRAEAAQLLRPIYEWFSEGLGTPDLRAAQALLAEISAP